MIRLTLDAAKKGMEKCVDDMRQNLATIRTGRASISILDHIQANYYGTPTPLNQMASLSTPDPTLIVIQPWDATAIIEIEKAIMKSNLGINPSNDGKVVRLSVPALSKERREELVKLVHKMSEEGRVSLRTIRRDAKESLEKLEKDKVIPEDDKFKGIDELQKLVDEYNKKTEDLAEKKKKEISE